LLTLVLCPDEARVSRAVDLTLGARPERKLGLRLSGDREAMIVGVASDMPGSRLGLAL
jgi:hypothetical protein